MKTRSMKLIYIIAGILSLALYVSGILTGVYIQKSISKSVEEDLISIKSDIENQQQELILFSLRGRESCAILQALSSSTASKLDAVSSDIRNLEQSGQKDYRFGVMKETYSTLSIRAWILRSAINENCDTKSLSIMYYYSFPCEKCKEQEKILESIKAISPDKILIYAVDKDVNNSLVKTLVNSHRIEIAPSLVASNEVYLGFTDEAKLMGLVCRDINVSC